ncbi:cyclic nucleotide-binding domain-containing protein [Streptomyces sp. NPDC059752]|uniref:cyclic nucleotide-binding domain-containing protein n=1 Tax=unclassified Streptomyces TaxID=2593676 RepID=UPI00366499F3
MVPCPAEPGAGRPIPGTRSAAQTWIGIDRKPVMRTTPPTKIAGALPAQHRSRLMGVAQEVDFPESARPFNEGGRADRFWIVRTGIVALDVHVPGRQPAVIESLGPGELVGCSWMLQPSSWRLGAVATTPVRTLGRAGARAPVARRLSRTALLGSGVTHLVAW